MLATLDWPWLVRAGLVVLAVAPGLGGARHAVPARPGRTAPGRGRCCPLPGRSTARSVWWQRHWPTCSRRRAGCAGCLLAAALLYVVCFAAYPRPKESAVAAIPHLTRRSLLGAAATAALAPPRLRRIRLDARGVRGGDAQVRPPGRPDASAVRRHPGAQARRDGKIESYLKDRLGSADPAVMRAFETVPREYYHYNYAERRALPGEAYEADPKPWALGYGSALSDYLGQAYMTQICKPQPGDTTLEIGTGSGFQSSLLSRIVKQALLASRSSSRWATRWPSCGRRSATPTSRAGSATAISAGPRSRTASTSSSRPAPRNTPRRTCSSS